MKLPQLHDSYDFAGNNVKVSNIVVTNEGPAVYLVYEEDGSGGWRTVDWDSSEVNRPLQGVVVWWLQINEDALHELYTMYYSREKEPADTYTDRKGVEHPNKMWVPVHIVKALMKGS